MKHLLKIFIVLLSAVVSAQAQQISAAKAAKVATTFFRNEVEEAAAPLEVRYAKTAADGHPAYFVLQSANAEGFVVVAGSEAIAPVLGYCDEGSFDPKNVPPAMAWLLSTYEKQAVDIRKNIAPANPEAKHQWMALESGRMMAQERAAAVAPLTTTVWGQGDPYNRQCPMGTNGARALTGCVATAMAQIVKYWDFARTTAPRWVQYTDSNGGAGDLTTGTFGAWVGGGYNWGQLPNDVTGGSSAVQIGEVARLMYHCGVGASMDYGVDASGSNISRAESGLRDIFGYNTTIRSRSDFNDTDWLNFLKGQLNSGFPLYYRGIDSDDGGHAWVLDGYNAAGLFHMNWGWDGGSNGYFSLPMGISFNRDQRIMIVAPPGCRPTAFLSGVQSNIRIEANQWIHSTAVVPAGATTVFSAGQSIVLLPGFTAVAGSGFYAVLHGCTGSGSATGSDSDAQDTSTEGAATPTKAEDLSIYPNPFAGTTTVAYHLDNPQPVTLRVLNSIGQVVLTPLQEAWQPAGQQQYQLEAGGLTSGVYVVSLTYDGKIHNRQMVVME